MKIRLRIENITVENYNDLAEALRDFQGFRLWEAEAHWNSHHTDREREHNYLKSYEVVLELVEDLAGDDYEGKEEFFPLLAAKTLVRSAHPFTS